MINVWSVSARCNVAGITSDATYGRFRKVPLMLWTVPARTAASSGHDGTFDDDQPGARSVHYEGYHGGNRFGKRHFPYPQLRCMRQNRGAQVNDPS
jgi:hypothetical protein